MDILLEDEEEFNQLVCVTARAIECYYLKYIHKEPCMDSTQTGNMWLMEVLQGNRKHCHRMFRMDKDVFIRLCNDLEVNYGLKDSRRMCAAEMLGMFLHTLRHGVGNRLAQERFQHSGETVSKYFGILLDVVGRLAMDVIKPSDPKFKDTPEEILRDERYMPHFKDCIGAIDGVHVQASISPQDQVPYIGRKGTPTQNVMAVCNFDMQFIFVCAGWEGSAHDARVFQSAIRSPTMNFPHPPRGKYYLVDAGYPQSNGYLGPYRGERYHPSLRSVIERTFGVWKKRWKILRDMPSYSYVKQVKIVVATMALHNYIRRYAKRDRHFEEISDDLDGIIETTEEESNQAEEYRISDGAGRREMEILRNSIVASLMGA